MSLKKYVPILDWLPNYKKDDIKGDLTAGLTVGVMLIPQGMAYAMIAGLPPIYGLYASTIPLLIYAVLGTSRQLAVGPVAMVSLLTAAGIGAIANIGLEEYIVLAIGLALLVGLIQFGLGVMRLGFLVNFLSHPVISGFTSAAALIIGLSQLKHLMGVDIPRSHHVHEILINAVREASTINWATLLIGLGGIGIIIFSKRIHQSIPGPLIAVILGVLAVWGFGLAESGVKVVGDVPGSLPPFKVPTFGGEHFPTLIPIALTIALVSFMESIAVAKAIQAKHKNYKVDPNQELIGLGLANVGGSFFSSYPVTGGFSRTAVNDQAGAKTGMAAIISAVLILLTLLFLTDLFYFLPKAILASVIMVAVFGLMDFKEPIHLWKSNRTDFAMLMITFVATLALGIEQGIGLGVILSLVMVIYRSTKPHVAELGKVPGTQLYRNIGRFEDLEFDPETLIVRFDADLYFANINYFKDTLDQLLNKRKGKTRTVILNAESISYMDSSAIHALEEFATQCKTQGIELALSGVKGPVRDALKKAGTSEKIGEERFFMSIHDAAIACAERCSNQIKKQEDFREYTLQTNV